MITRRPVYLQLRDDAPNEASAQREGWALVPAAFDADEVRTLRSEIEQVYANVPADIRNPRLPEEQREDFRYEMLNRSAACQRAASDRRLLDIVEPLLGEDCHVIANTAWRNPPRKSQHGGGLWHMDAGPHVPRPPGVPWDDRIPYPVFAIGIHLLLEPCPLACGPTEVLAGSHRSGQALPLERVKDDDLRYDDREPVVLSGKSGDVAFFVSDLWHRRRPTTADDAGRFFLQVHYGRRDIAQRLRTTQEAGQVSPEAAARACDDRAKTVIGIHRPFFYDG